MRFASANPGLPVGRAVCSYGDCGACPSVKSPVAEPSGGVASAALFAAHRALIAAASCSRRSGERLSFLFTFLGADACTPAGFTCDFAVELRFSLPARAARAIDFFFAFAALALTKAASFPFSLASFFGPSSSRVSRRRIFFLRVLNFITRSGWLVYIDNAGWIWSLMTKPHKCHVIVLWPLPFGRLLRLSTRTFLSRILRSIPLSLANGQCRQTVTKKKNTCRNRISRLLTILISFLAGVSSRPPES